MAHFALTHATWPDSFVPGHASFEDLDLKTSKAINGDNGGSWAPDTSPVEVGGLGLSARHVYGLVVTGANADTTYAIAGARLIYLDSGITADRAYTLGATGAVQGDVMEIVALPTMGAARKVSVRDNLGAELVRIGNPTTSTANSPYAKFVFLGTQWRLLSSRQTGMAIVAAGGIASIASTTVSSATVVDIAGYSFGITCQVGDVLMVTMHLGIALTTSAQGTVEAVVVDGGTPVAKAAAPYLDFGSISIDRPQIGTFSYAAAYVVQNAGTVTWKGAALMPYGGSMLLGGTAPASISVLQLRP